MVAARRARVRLRFRLGGTLLLREEPAGDVQASGLFVHRGLDDVQGHPHRPRSLLIGTAGIRSRVETHRRTRRSGLRPRRSIRSEEHTSELQSLMRISYAVFCLKKKTKNILLANRQNHMIHVY